MTAAKKAAAKESPQPRKSEADRKSAVQETTKFVTYLAPGQAPKIARPDARLDPELEKVREQERKVNDAVSVEPRKEPTIDDALVKARDEQIKRETKRASENK